MLLSLEMPSIQYKPFDKKLYDSNDKIAKEVILKHLSKKFDVIENSDKYGPDLIVVSKQTKISFFAEVEIKQNWNKEIFPFSTVNIPKRKDKYLKYGPIIYFILSKNLSQAIAIDGKHLKTKYLNEVANKHISSGEFFFQIPINLCKIIKIT